MGAFYIDPGFGFLYIITVIAGIDNHSIKRFSPSSPGGGKESMSSPSSKSASGSLEAAIFISIFNPGTTFQDHAHAWNADQSTSLVPKPHSKVVWVRDCGISATVP